VARLVDVSAALSATYNRLCGELLDCKEHGMTRAELPAVDPHRYEVATRFFMTPGSEQLREQGARLIACYGVLRSAYDEAASWEQACRDHGAAVRAFEAAVRAVVRRGCV
jgi:hypothetical protein